jgi:hypothetical protein
MQHEVAINKDIPWDCFDGASQGNPSKGGLCEIICLSSYHIISLHAIIGQETKKLCELMTLNMFMKLAQIWYNPIANFWRFKVGYPMDVK